MAAVSEPSGMGRMRRDVQKFTIRKDVIFWCGNWNMPWLTLAGSVIQCTEL